MTSDKKINEKLFNSNKEKSKHLKKQKPEFQEFLLTLKTFIATQNKGDNIPKINNYIKKGFKGNIEPRHVDEILRELLGWKDLPRLAMRMAVEASIGRPMALVEKLIVPIRDELARRISFPIARVRNVFDSKMKSDLEDWIAKKSSEGALDASWVRDSLTCIMRENITEEEFAIIHSIVDSCCSRKIKTPRKKEVVQPKKYTNYIKQIGTLFTSGQFKPSKFFLALDICKPFSDELKMKKIKLDDSNAELQIKNGELLELRKSLKSVNQELEEAHIGIEKLQQQVRLKEQALLDERERFRMLDEHWEKEVVRESQGKIFELKKYFEHEVREAKLSLDRESPNVQMALNRILHMEEYLNRIGENA